MRRLPSLLLGALLVFGAAGPPSARAGSAIAKTGVPDADKGLGEVSSAGAVLDAAEARMAALLKEVAAPLGLPADAPLDRSVWTLKQKAGGDVRAMNADGRTVLVVGPSAPSEARNAASALNEGTQELAVMAEDLGRMPARLTEIAARAEAVALDGPRLQAAGLDPGKLGELRKQHAANVASTREVATRAEGVATRARSLLGAVQSGMDAASEPHAPAVAAAPAPQVVAPAPRPGGAPVPTVGEVLVNAWAQFNDAEMDAAVDLLAQADLSLPRQAVPVQRAELLELFQLRGLVNLVKGDASEAAWAVTQALVVHPTSIPPAKLGPDYAKLHKAIQKAGVVRKVDVAVKGEGRAYLSGIEVTGGSVVQLGQGQHLLQIEKDGAWRSSVVYVKDGFVVQF